jgi:hypothetical protein
MQFELSRTKDDSGSTVFSSEPVNMLKWLKEFLIEKDRAMYPLVAVTNRTDGKSIPFEEAIPFLDKMYYCNEYAEYFLDKEAIKPWSLAPVFNFDLIFNLSNGDFIDFKAFILDGYDGSMLYYGLRYNWIRFGEWERSNDKA